MARMQFGGSVRARQATRPAPTGWACCSPLTMASRAGAALIIPYFVRRHRHAHAFTASTCGSGTVGLLSMMLIREPEWLLVSMIGLGVRLGLHHCLALRDARQQPSVAEDGREHRHLQHLHRDPAIARRERAAAAARRVRRRRPFLCAGHRRRRLVPRRRAPCCTSGHHVTRADRAEAHR